MPAATVGERLHVEWQALAYQGFCGCATCGTEANCKGVNPDSRVCESCFTGVHKGKAPNYRRRRKTEFSSSIAAARTGGRKKGGAMTVLAEPRVEEIVQMQLKELQPAKDNVRRQVGDVDELAASIKAQGVLEPLIATPNGKGYVVVIGNRRLAAAKKAGIARVPVIVRDYTDAERLQVMLIENLQRENLAPTEEAEGYRRLVELGVTQRDVAARVGRSQGHVSKRLALLELPADVQKKADSGGIRLEDALELSKLIAYPEALKRALKPLSWETVADAVTRELRDIDHEKKLIAIEERLESKGLRTVRVPTEWSLGGAIRLRDKSANGYVTGEALPIDVAEHARLDCHAIAVTRSGQEIPVCLDRKQHPKLQTPNEKLRTSGGRSTGESAAQQRERQELEQATETRRAFIRDLLAKKTPLPKATTAQLIARCILGITEPDLALAAELAGVLPDIDLSESPLAKLGSDTVLHVVKEQKENKAGRSHVLTACDVSGVAEVLDPAQATIASTLCPRCVHAAAEGEWEAYERPLEQLIAAGEAPATKVALALCLASIEQGLGSYRPRWDDASVRGHYATLEAAGYQPSPIEKKKLDEAAAGSA